MFHLLHRGLAEQVLAVVLIFGLLVRVFVGVWGLVLFLFGFLDLVRTNCLIRTAVGAAISGAISKKHHYHQDERSTGAKKNLFRMSATQKEVFLVLWDPRPLHAINSSRMSVLTLTEKVFKESLFHVCVAADRVSWHFREGERRQAWYQIKVFPSTHRITRSGNLKK